MYALRGVAAILFGIAAFGWPHLTIAVLIVLFGAYAFVDGIFLIISALAGWSQIEDPWLILLEGLIGVAIGAVTFHSPAITGLALLIYIAAWSLATGVLEIAAAMRLRKEMTGEFWLLLSGIPRRVRDRADVQSTMGALSAEQANPARADSPVLAACFRWRGRSD